MTLDQSSLREQTIGDYIAVVFRYKWLILVTTIVVPIAAYLYSSHQAKVFQASSEVYLNTQTSDITSAITGLNTNPVYDPDRALQTQAQLAREPAVAQAALALAKVTSIGPGRLRQMSKVIAQNGTDFLEFQVTDGDPV